MTFECWVGMLALPIRLQHWDVVGHNVHVWNSHLIRYRLWHVLWSDPGKLWWCLLPGGNITPLKKENRHTYNYRVRNPPWDYSRWGRVDLSPYREKIVEYSLWAPIPKPLNLGSTHPYSHCNAVCCWEARRKCVAKQAWPKAALACTLCKPLLLCVIITCKPV